MSDYLSNKTIHKLTDAIISGGLHTPDVRDDLLVGIRLGFVATLPLRTNFLDQVRSDLVELNRVPYLIGYEVPIKIWLENAVHRLEYSFRPEQRLFQEILKDVTVKSDSVIQKARGCSNVQDLPENLERIVHQDDLLEYGWLAGAVKVGTSVARLLITRYENGQTVTLPGSTRPIQYKGTGWLIGKQYIITNHHVINARSESEPNASETDLFTQAKTAIVQFDYDIDGASGSICPVESLVEWVEWNTTPTLDFAILKLKESSQRSSLILAPLSLTEIGEQSLPVNVIQHPNGNAKSLGIRNNLTNSVTEWELSYFTDTMQGSSGSPVCNDRWQVIALHRAWKYVHEKIDFQGKPAAWANSGVRIDRIIEYMQTYNPVLWKNVEADVI